MVVTLEDCENTDICVQVAPPSEDLAVKATAFMPSSITLLLSAWATAWMLFVPAPVSSVVHDWPASTDLLATPLAPTTKTTTPSKEDAP